MLRALLFVFVSVFAVSAQAQSWKPEMIQRAAEAADICVRHMPNSQAAKDDFQARGFRYEGSDGEFHYYSQNGRRLIVGTTVTSSHDQGCLVSVSRMTPAEATELAQGTVRATHAEAVPIPANRQREFSSGWLGSVRGRQVLIAVRDHVNFGIMRGAAVFMVIQ